MKTFEDKIKELQAINQELANVDKPLAEVVAKYEQGKQIYEELKAEIEAAKLVLRQENGEEHA